MSLGIIEKLGEFQDELEKLKTATEEIKQAGKIASECSELSGKVLNTFIDLIEPTNKLIDKIDKVDFPIRLDKLDVAITSINSGMNNLIQRTDTVEREIKEKIDTKLSETNNNIKTLTDIQNEQLKLLKIISIVTLIIVLVIVTMVFIKQ